MPLAALLGLLHFLVDAASLTALYREVALDRLPYETIIFWIDAYNLIAFGLQTPLAVFVDRWRAYRGTMLVGLIGVAAGLAVGVHSSPAAVIAVGLGNAAFHVGAGGLVLRRSAGRAAELGVFVAPGGLGVAVGVRFGGSGPAMTYLLLTCLLAAAAGVALNRLTSGKRANGEAGCEGGSPPTRVLWMLGAGMLLVSVVIRSMAAGTLSTPPSGAAVIAFPLLALAAVAGKAIGGFVADRVGWRVTAVGSLLALAAVVGLGSTSPSARLAGMFLTHATMAVTLAGLFAALPTRPGTAFGLTSFALLLGTIPETLGLAPCYDPASHLFALVLLSAVTALAGLSLVPDDPPRTPNIRRTSSCR